jgi:hypothetical protein
LPQLKAQAAICIVFWPGTAGELLKWKVIVVFPFINTNELAGVPFTVKSLASTVPGSAAPLRLTVKSVGAVPTTMLPQTELVTEQSVGVAVGVGVGVGVFTSSLSVKASCWYTPLMGTRPSTHEERCLVAVAEA